MNGAKADAVLWILAGVSIALLAYEGWTLGTSVILPLLDKPNILQTDFHYYYEAAMRFRGDASKLYLPTDDVIAGFAYPPPAIVPFVLLSHAPLGLAFLIFTLASYAALFGAVWLWLGYLRDRGRDIDRPTAIAVTLVAVAFGPTYMNAVFGQVNTFVLGCSVAFIALASRLRQGFGAQAWSLVAGALLATGIWLKIYPALIAAVGLWDRRTWRAIGAAAVAGIILAIAALLVVPIDSYRSFLEVLSTRADKTAVHITNQSLMAFVERCSIAPDEFLNWTGREAVTTSAVLRVANSIFGLGVIVLLWRRARAGAGVQSAAALIALAAVIAPLGWGHTFVLVLPLVITHLTSLPRSPALTVAFVCACVLALMIPAGRRFSFVEQWPAWLQNVAYSRYLIATMILIALPQGDKK